MENLVFITGILVMMFVMVLLIIFSLFVFVNQKMLKEKQENELEKLRIIEKTKENEANMIKWELENTKLQIDYQSNLKDFSEERVSLAKGVFKTLEEIDKGKK